MPLFLISFRPLRKIAPFTITCAEQRKHNVEHHTISQILKMDNDWSNENSIPERR